MSHIILFRFDASATIGLGHAMRCMAIIEQLINFQAEIVVSTYQLPSYIRDKLKCFNVNVKTLHGDIGSIEDQEALLDLASQYNVSVVVLDGYSFNEQYRQALKKNINNIVTFDDTNDLNNLFCDLVINALSTANTFDYQSSAPQAKHLLGLQYSILRSEFLSLKSPPFANRKSLFINFGGSDAGDLTLPVIQLLAQSSTFSAGVNGIVVTGGGCQNVEEIAIVCQQLGFEHHHNTNNISLLMNQSALAICASGSMVYELAYSQLPSVLLTVADNQVLSAHSHQALGWCRVFDGRIDGSLSLAINTAIELWCNKLELKKMSIIASKLIDGKGAQRIASQILQGVINE